MSDSGCVSGTIEPRAPVNPSSKNSPVESGVDFQDFRVSNKSSKGPSKERIDDDKKILALQTEALRAQLEETLKLNGDQVNQLLEDRRVMIEGS